MKLVVTVVGVDRVGIIAGVSTVLANYGVNICPLIRPSSMAFSI